MVRGIAHICFTVRNLEASVEFYRDTLGLTPAFEYVDERGERFGIYLHAGARTFIELFKGEVGERVSGQSYQHFCLEVEDVQAAVSELRARGVQITDPKLGNDRSWQAWVTDPDGNEIELHGYTPESKQAGWVSEPASRTCSGPRKSGV